MLDVLRGNNGCYDVEDGEAPEDVKKCKEQPLRDRRPTEGERATTAGRSEGGDKPSSC